MEIQARFPDVVKELAALADVLYDVKLGPGIDPDYVGYLVFFDENGEPQAILGTEDGEFEYLENQNGKWVRVDLLAGRG